MYTENVRTNEKLFLRKNSENLGVSFFDQTLSYQSEGTEDDDGSQSDSDYEYSEKDATDSESDGDLPSIDSSPPASPPPNTSRDKETPEVLAIDSPTPPRRQQKAKNKKLPAIPTPRKQVKLRLTTTSRAKNYLVKPGGWGGWGSWGGWDDWGGWGSWGGWGG